MRGVSVIIPVFNEQRTITRVIDAVRSWRKAREIIVVDDGSIDGTLDRLKSLKKFIKIISYTNNRGKGYALGRGIEHSTSTILMFLDGDIIGLTSRDLDRLVDPVESRQADMTLGLVRFWAFKVLGPAKEITGERVVLKKNITPYMAQMKAAGYGVELFLNTIHANKRVVGVSLPSVYIVDKFFKLSLVGALRLYIKEWKELITQMLQG